jgi:serine/threonine-protein kinase
MTGTATGPWREALAAIDTLLSLPEPDREQRMADLASTRPELHARVRALLEADAEATRTGFLAIPRSGDERVATLEPGTRLGPYRIVGELGTGGMGEVWRARRDDGLYDGEVAIKTLHPFFAQGAMRERFLREAQLLGKLAHPNIARLLDAGVADGVVYLVLEYVRGEPIDAWCDARRAGIEARLELFAKVCDAVAHAHANLIVHRDIKPSNILVDDAGQVKLLDFGIGKILETDPAGAQRTELTRVTGRVFTPEYAAPEQILGEPVTTATDEYSLGTLLYVLLCGARPFGNELTGARVERAVLHEEPKTLGRLARAAGDEAAARRGLSTARLAKLLSGDLDDIALRALRRQPGERYGSVQALADDLRRFRRHEPVLARAGSGAYRLGRFVRRHRVAVAASAGVMLAAAAGVAGVLYQAGEAREQARLARQEAAKATAVKDYLLSIFEANSALHPDGAAARKTTAEQLMDIATRQLLAEKDRDPELRLELMTVLHNIVGQLEKYSEQEALGLERIQVAERHFGAADVRLADAWNDHSEFLRQRGRFAEARAAATRAVELREAQGDRESWTRGVSEVQLGQIAYGEWDGKGDGPIAHFRRAIAIFDTQPPTHEQVRAWLGLARSYEYVMRFEEAIDANRRGIDLAIRVDGPRTTSVAGGHQQMSRVLAKLFRLQEAEQHLARAVEVFTFAHGAENGFTMNARLDVGRTLVRRGRFIEAAAGLEDVLAMYLRVHGSSNYWTQQVRLALASATIGTGDFARADRLLLDCLEQMTSDANRRIQPGVVRLLAASLVEQGRFAEALDYLGRADLRRMSPAALPAFKAQFSSTRVHALAGAGRVREAQAELESALASIAETDQDPDRFDTLLGQLAAARVALARRDPQSARDRAREVLERLAASARRADGWHIEEQAQRRLAEAEFALGNSSAACVALDEAIRLRSSHALAKDPRLLAAKRMRATCT